MDHRSAAQRSNEIQAEKKSSYITEAVENNGWEGGEVCVCAGWGGVGVNYIHDSLGGEGVGGGLGAGGGGVGELDTRKFGWRRRVGGGVRVGGGG